MPYVVLVGPPGAGKSTIARRLAHSTHLPMVDSDDLIAEQQGMPTGQYYASVGEDSFRETEHEAVKQALSSSGIVALGGGAVVNPATRELLKDYPVVWVDVGLSTGLSRTMVDGTRPILESEDPEARYREILESRKEFYREVAKHRIRTDARTPQQSVAEILAFLENIDD